MTTPTMQDLPRDLQGDPMIAPTVSKDFFRLQGETFAQAYITYINWVHNHPEHIDPMDTTVVY